MSFFAIKTPLNSGSPTAISWPALSCQRLRQRRRILRVNDRRVATIQQVMARLLDRRRTGYFYGFSSQPPRLRNCHSRLWWLPKSTLEPGRPRQEQLSADHLHNAIGVWRTGCPADLWQRCHREYSRACPLQNRQGNEPCHSLRNN